MKSLLIFIGGLTIGAVVSWVYHKNKYEEMIQEEVESLRTHASEKKVKTTVSSEYGVTKDEVENSEECDYMAEEEKRQEEYEQLLHDNNYTNDEENMAEKYKKPFVVSPNEFATIPGFDTDTFYYHIDDIIVNDMNEIVDDVEHILGMSVEEINEQFGVYEDDSVFIRNVRLKCDYEILRDDTEYLRRNGD